MPSKNDLKPEEQIRLLESQLASLKKQVRGSTAAFVSIKDFCAELDISRRTYNRYRAVYDRPRLVEQPCGGGRKAIPRSELEAAKRGELWTEA